MTNKPLLIIFLAAMWFYIGYTYAERKFESEFECEIPEGLQRERFDIKKENTRT